MDKFIPVSESDLQPLMQSMTLLERLEDATESLRSLCLFGFTENAEVLDKAKESISDEESSAPDVAAIVVVLPLSSDTLFYLLGSGLALNGEEFAYRGTPGEGVRTGNFERHTGTRLRVRFNSFNKVVLSSDSVWAEDFLQQQATASGTVERTEEATENPKQSSVKISEIVQKWLS